MSLDEKLINLLEEKKFAEIKKILSTKEPADIKIIFDKVPLEDVPFLFRLLPKDEAADTFVEMDPGTQGYLISAFSDFELRQILDFMFMDDTVDLIEEMPANLVKRILRNTTSKDRQIINEMLKYPKDTAGSIMTTEFVSLRSYMSVSEAFQKIRRTGINKETVYTCYITDRNKKLIGITSIKTLLLNDNETLIGDIMDKNYICVHTLEDKEDVAKKFSKYDFLALPVVDNENRLVGIVTFDDAIDVIQEENTEDFEKMAAMAPSEDSYFKTSAFKHARKRFGWLLFLMLSATLTQAIINNYEKAFEAIPLLVGFIPMLTGTGGNCGSQSSTMIIRGIALDEIKPNDAFKAILKESQIALIVGVLLAVVNGIRVMLIYKDVMIALVLGVTLVLTILLSKLLGCILPLCAKKFKLDPAIMATPLISTVVDSCSVLIYFNVAIRMLGL